MFTRRFIFGSSLLSTLCIKANGGRHSDFCWITFVLVDLEPSCLDLFFTSIPWELIEQSRIKQIKNRKKFFRNFVDIISTLSNFSGLFTPSMSIVHDHDLMLEKVLPYLFRKCYKLQTPCSLHFKR